MSLPHEIKKATGSSNEDVTSFLELISLKSGRGTSIHNARAKHGTVTETTSFIEDLGSQLTSWAYDQNQRLRANGISDRIKSLGDVWTRCSKLLRLSHELGENWNEESTRFSGP